MQKVKVSVAVDEEIHKRLKYKSFDEGVNIQQIVEDALNRYLRPEVASEQVSIENSKKSIQQLFKRLLNDGDMTALATIKVALQAIDNMVPHQSNQQLPNPDSQLTDKKVA